MSYLQHSEFEASSNQTFYLMVVIVFCVHQILHLFKTHAQGVHITGGQYFAALRILMHLRNGSELNEGLAYVQGG